MPARHEGGQDDAEGTAAEEGTSHAECPCVGGSGRGVRDHGGGLETERDDRVPDTCRGRAVERSPAEQRHCADGGSGSERRRGPGGGAGTSARCCEEKHGSGYEDLE